MRLLKTLPGIVSSTVFSTVTRILKLVGDIRVSVYGTKKLLKHMKVPPRFELGSQDSES